MCSELALGYSMATKSRQQGTFSVLSVSCYALLQAKTQEKVLMTDEPTRLQTRGFSKRARKAGVASVF